jgi:hypothetical protein
VPAITLPKSPVPLEAGGLRTLLRKFGAPDEFGNPAPAHTGCITIVDPVTGREGLLFLRAGRIYAAALSGFVPPVAIRLLSGGLLTAEAYQHLASVAPEKVGAEALKAGYCTSDDIEDVHRQMLLSTITHIYGWSEATWTWTDGTDTEAFTISPLETSLLATAADERIGQWNALTRNFLSTTKGDAVPQPGPGWSAKAGEATTPEIASILTHVNGKNTIAQIASACGFTRFEIAARLAKAIADMILIIPDPDGVKPVEIDGWEDTPAGISSIQHELDEASAAVEQAKAALAAAEARLARAQSAGQSAQAARKSPRRPQR